MIILKKRIYSPIEISLTVKQLAFKISEDYKNSDSLVLVGILKGAFIFLADLARAMTTNHAIDFIDITSYNNRGSDQGEVKLLLDTRLDLTGKDVLLVEDIIDSGKTMIYLKRLFASKGAKSVKTCVLITKGKDLVGTVDYCGLIANKKPWLVGYGLDYKEECRTLNGIYEIDLTNMCDPFDIKLEVK